MGNTKRVLTLSPETLADLERRDRELRSKVASLSWEEAEQKKDAQERDTRAAGRLMLLVLVCSGCAGFLGLKFTAGILAAFGAAVLLIVPAVRRFRFRFRFG